MDKVKYKIQGEVSWYIKFADDIVMIKETLEEVNNTGGIINFGTCLEVRT